MAMSPMSLTSMRNLDIKRTNHFEVILSLSHLGIPDSKNLSLSIESFTPPVITTTPIILSYGNGKLKLAGDSEVADATIVFRDFLEFKTSKILSKWRDKVYNIKNDIIGHQKDYKTEGKLFEYDSRSNLLDIYVLEGLWPSSVDKGENTMESADKKIITVTLTCDKCYLQED